MDQNTLVIAEAEKEAGRDLIPTGESRPVQLAFWLKNPPKALDGSSTSLPTE